MDRNRGMSEILDQALSGRLSRRDVLRRGLALGLSVPAIGALLAACGSSKKATATVGAGTTGTTPTTATGATSPTSTTAATSAVSSPSASAEKSPTKASSPVVEGSPTGSPSTGGAYPYTKDNPPPVPNADAAKQYSGTKIVFWGDAVGPGAEMDTILSTQFTKDTGIQVQVVPRPASSDESFAQYQRTFQGQSSDMDCGMIDVVWPGALAPHLVDLSDAFKDDLSNFYDTIVASDTIDGKLVGVPWFGDFGILYYRTDLLQKYNFSNPPQTWDELEQQAKAIMDGEKASNPNFTGFVFQGNAYEGLTCNALEWLASQGAGTIVDENKKVTLNTDPAKAALNRARGWVGTISPQGVTSYQEDETLNAFQTGNAAFARNWPYAYASGVAAGSPIQGKFDVGPLPAQAGSDHVGTVGGWQIGVSKYSKNQEAAIEYARYITSPEIQKFRAIVTSFVPTRPAVAEDPDVVAAMPFLKNAGDIVRVTRPSSAAGQNYNEFSTDFFQGCNSILTGTDADTVVPDLTNTLQGLLDEG